MTFTKDYSKPLLYLLPVLVKDAINFEEIVSGSAARLTHIKEKVEELWSKVNKMDSHPPLTSVLYIFLSVVLLSYQKSAELNFGYIPGTRV